MPAGENHCGTCTACCNAFAIPPLAKPAGKWCQHCDIGVGCKVYADRPQMCVDYECLWLQSQKQKDVQLEPELRPDRCRVIFSPTTNETIISAVTMPGSPGAWRSNKAVRAFIDMLVRGGLRVSAGPAGATDLVIVHRGGETPVTMTEPDENGMQWRVGGGA